MNRPQLSHSVRTRSDVPLTAWAQVNENNVVVAEHCFQVTTEEALAAGYDFNPTGLAQERAYAWGKNIMQNLRDNAR
jgi:hypothetical protein